MQRSIEVTAFHRQDSWEVGYCPRAVVVAGSPSWFCIGARDGRLTWIPSTRDLEPTSGVQPRRILPAIEALHGDRDELLIGDGCGGVWRFHSANEATGSPYRLSNPPQAGGVQGVSSIHRHRDSDEIFVSFPDQTGVISWSRDDETAPETPHPVGTKEGLGSICRFASLSTSVIAAVSRFGDLWLLEKPSDESRVWQMRRVDPWQETADGQPGLVTATVELENRGRGQLVLATELGLHSLSIDQNGRSTVRALPLPGIRGLPTALAYLHRERDLLWVADSGGIVHLFQQSHAGGWSRIYSHRLQAQVTAMAAAENDGGEVRLVQALRSDAVLVTDYLTGYKPEDIESLSPHQALTLLDLDIAMSWWKEHGSKSPQEQRGWLEVALAGSWPMVTQIADWIEQVAVSCAGRPGAATRPPIEPMDLFATFSIRRSLLEKLTRTGEIEPREAAQVWTHTLLGVIGRWVSPSDREAAYLGVIRWLRSLSDLEDAEWKKPAEHSIQAVRRWGILGARFAERKNPLYLLERLSNPKRGGAHLEHLILGGLIFQNQFDIEENQSSRVTVETTRPPTYRRSDRRTRSIIRCDRSVPRLATLSEGGELEIRKILPRRWASGDKDVYRGHRLKTEGLSDFKGYLPKIDVPLTLTYPEEWSKTETVRALTPIASGFVLGFESGGWAALGIEDQKWSCDRTDGHSRPWRLRDEEYGAITAITCLGDPDSDTGRMLFGCQNGDLWIVKHENTHDGSSTPVAWAITPQSRPSAPRSPRDSGERLEDDPITVLAKLERQGRPQTCEVVVACQSGEIWSSPEEALNDPQSRGEWIKVGRLSRPITALTAIHHRVDEVDVDRVIAGSDNGTLAAWQRIDDGQRPSRWVLLWALHEEAGKVIELDHFTSSVERRRREALPADCMPMIFAAFGNGRLVVLYDRPTHESPDDFQPNRHLRLIGPGTRLLRIDLEEPCCAATLLKPEMNEIEKLPKETRSPFALLAVGGRFGEVKIVSLYYPSHTESRRERFEQLGLEWTELIKNPNAGIKNSVAGLRYNELAYVVDPMLPRFLIGLMLRAKSAEELGLGRTEKPDALLPWVPRLHRATAAMIFAWDPLIKNSSNEANDKDSWINKLAESLKNAWGRKKEKTHVLAELFREALRRAEEVNDLELVREILIGVLRRSNRTFYQLFEPGKPETVAEFAKIFQPILEVVRDEVCQEAKIRGKEIDLEIHKTIAQALPDGDTFWKIFQKQDHKPSAELVELLKSRLKLTVQCLNHDNPTVVLETLRASNLGVVRACLRLERSNGPELVEDLDGNAVQESLETIRQFATRAVRIGRGALSDALAHEIARAYALMLVACPTRIAHLTSMMYESNIPESVLPRITDQLLALETLSDRLRLPEHAWTIYRIQTVERPEKNRSKDPPYFFWSGDRPKVPEEKVGLYNQSFLQEARTFERIVQFLDEFARQLEENPGAVEPQKFAELRKSIRKQQGWTEDEDRPPYAFGDSLGFWDDSWKELEDELAFAEDLEKWAERVERSKTDSTTGPVSPHLLLSSLPLADWCRSCLQDLEKRERERRMFKPDSDLYRDVLERLEKAARALPGSAAVHRNVVRRVFDHGLLARLDEHLLGLWEAAHVLDPIQARNWRGPSEDEPKATAERFAVHLLKQAHQAESFPKCLRSIRGYLGGEPSNERPIRTAKAAGGSSTEDEDLGPFLRSFSEPKGWIFEADEDISDQDGRGTDEEYYLHLCLSELDHNHRAFGQEARRPKLHYRRNTGEIRLELPIFESRRQQLEKLLEKEDFTLKPMESEDADGNFKGTGFYLAHLAAATVGWSMYPSLKDQPIFEVLLTKISPGAQKESRDET